MGWPARLAFCLVVLWAIRAPGAACALGHGRLVLLRLAQCCATDLASERSCRLYDAADDYVVVKDNSPRKPAAYLIIPSVPVTGIDDRQIFQEPFADFWEFGWAAARRFVGRPESGMGLAINSIHARTQDQLHIHISCVLPAVAGMLAAHDAAIGFDPKQPLALALPPHGNPYRVVKANGLADGESPYRLVAARAAAADDMADQGIAVVGSATAGVYYVLDTYAHGLDFGGAEELLDQTCR